jgi:methionyl aminopeptidase
MEKQKCYTKAGNVLGKAIALARTLVKPNESMLECAEKIESKISSLGAKPAFPVNLSVNEEAAHRTPDANEQTVFGEQDVVKVDIGVHVEGCIADAAFTVDLSGEHAKLVEASEHALKMALEAARKHSTLGEIGSVIEKTIRSAGYVPIQNLGGHGLGDYDAHAPPHILNIAKDDSRTLEIGRAYAIEPFASTGSGFVRESGQANIFSIEKLRSVRNTHARSILKFVLEEYKTLPFAERWLHAKMKLSEFQLKVGLRALLREKCLRAYPVLKEEPGTTVSQSENSFIVTEKGITVLWSTEKADKTAEKK